MTGYIIAKWIELNDGSTMSKYLAQDKKTWTHFIDAGHWNVEEAEKIKDNLPPLQENESYLRVEPDLVYKYHF